jgi:alpha-galactosidase/6-phospho-beta-glucosidase family protein
MVVQAFMADLTALKKADAEKLVDAILKAHATHLPNFR